MQQAGAVKMPFGEHLGRSIAAVASTSSGLEYLDWLRDRSWVKPEMRDVIQTYLADPGVQEELESAIARRASGRRI